MSSGSTASVSTPARPRLALHAALFLVSANLVLWEVLLTRIFSTILYYHFAFMAVSVSMFGLTLGAVLVFLRPLAQERVMRTLGWLAISTAVVTSAAIAVQLALPLNPDPSGGTPSSYLALTYVLSALPFIPGGAFICLVLTRFSGTGPLYAADLAGSAAGCALMPLIIVAFNGPGAVLAAAACSAIAGAVVLKRDSARGAIGSVLLALALLAAGQLNVSQQWLRVRYRHNGPNPPPVYESWNAFSRIMINPYWSLQPFSYGIDQSFKPELPEVKQLWLEIDSGAATPITEFNGDPEKVSYLRHELCAVSHRLRENADVCIIGPGGGRDVLAALAYHQKSVVGIEVNPDILYADNVVFGDFSGHLDKRKDVSFVCDDGRSWLVRTDKRFDIIQASFVDTVAATAAGAYAFTENGLYTVEAWKLFMQRLKPRGVLSFSRFYYGSTTWPVEVCRLIALGSAALRDSGVQDPANHILLIRSHPYSQKANVETERIVTLLVSPDPFTAEDVARAKQACADLRCDLTLAPGVSIEDSFKLALNTTDPAELRRAFPLDVTPTYDDRPYFFFHTRLADILAGTSVQNFGGSAFNLPAVRTLVTLTVTVLALGLLLVIFPIVWFRLLGQRGVTSGPILLPVYFAAIGVAFMLVEIGLIQRLSLFLGHPIYGFTVVLFGLLLATGAGSMVSGAIFSRLRPGAQWLVLGAAAGVIVLSESAGVALLHQASSASTPARIALTLLVICPSAFFMGFGFPLGMNWAARQQDGRTAWFWAINGATSVIGSVVAMLVSIELGIHLTIAAGALIYLIAAALHGLGSRGTAKA